VSVLLLAVGTISEILPTFARKPIFSHRAAAGSIAAIAALGVLAWMQNMYTAPIPKGWEFFAMLMAVALIVPVGLLVVNWIATIWRGALRITSASLFALGSLSTIVIGLAGELSYSVIPVGWQLDNTTAAQGDTAFVVVGGAVLGGFAALHYWFPKMTGRAMGEGLGRASFWTILAGVHLFCWPMFLAGLKGQPVDIQKFYEGLGLDGFNVVATIGALILLAGILVAVANVAISYRGGLRTGHDPWGGTTLEWFALSPPPPHNFDAVPDVRSGEPLRDIRQAILERGELWPRATPAPQAEPEPEAEQPAPVAAEAEVEEPGEDGGAGPDASDDSALS
jgi:heme/copper-type cytochrome/quinol oxidase subunit 1